MLARIIFGIILLVHGLIHLMGVVKAFGLAEIEALKLPISRFAGLVWGLATLLFLFSAVVYLLRVDWWWIPAAIGIVVSQGLVFMYWQDARFGTVANVIILVGCFIGYGQWDFRVMVNSERSEFGSSVAVPSPGNPEATIADLPTPVRAWLNNSEIRDNDPIATVKFSQRGKMKISPGGSWMPVRASQLVRTADPGFLWVADVEAAPYIHLAGRDKYLNGKGHMLIKLLSLVPVADTKGPEIDQGAMLRYLAEMVWYPTAALAPYIRWTPVDDSTAEATITYGDMTASGTFSFSSDGKVTGIKARRYYSRDGRATLEPWVITIDPESYKLVNGYFVPAKACITWELEEGPFTWFELEVYDLEYDR